jgi:hypothetical protein
VRALRHDDREAGGGGSRYVRVRELSAAPARSAPQRGSPNTLGLVSSPLSVRYRSGRELWVMLL